MGFKMMWQNVLLEKDPYKCNSMIKDILLLQPYLSSYYEATKLVLEKKRDYKNESDKEEQQHEQPQQQWQLQEDKEEKEKELNGDPYKKYQQQETITFTNRESSRTESTTDFYNNKNRKF